MASLFSSIPPFHELSNITFSHVFSPLSLKHALYYYKHTYTPLYFRFHITHTYQHFCYHFHNLCSCTKLFQSKRNRKMGSGDNIFTLVAKNIDVLAMPLISLVYPLYCSIQAIETKSREDDQQWLTYWVLYSLITLFELTFATILEWFPIWSYAKLIAVCWLVLPYFNGAAYVYEHFIRPFYKNPTVKIWYVPLKNDIFRKPDDILTAAEKYIEENGPQAFERIIARADRDSRARRNSYTVFHDDYEY